MSECFFCSNNGGITLFNCDLYRIILVDSEADYPGFLRVVVNRHVKEMSDLSENEAVAIYHELFRCEQILRKLCSPDKVNIASLGNVTPHVHWHIIPRFLNDKHYPNPIWGGVVNAEYQPATSLLDVNHKIIKYFKDIFC